MKIVIDIPEDEYEFCKKQWDTECLDTLMIAVKYGTPLPENLNKIKAEIGRMNCLSIEDGSDGYDDYIDRYDVLQIIDKYS